MKRWKLFQLLKYDSHIFAFFMTIIFELKLYSYASFKFELKNQRLLTIATAKKSLSTVSTTNQSDRSRREGIWVNILIEGTSLWPKKVKPTRSLQLSHRTVRTWPTSKLQFLEMVCRHTTSIYSNHHSSNSMILRASQLKSQRKQESDRVNSKSKKCYG